MYNLPNPFLTINPKPVKVKKSKKTEKLIQKVMDAAEVLKGKGDGQKTLQSS